MNILYVRPGPMPSNDLLKNEFFHLPEPLSGDILLLLRGREPEDVLRALGPDSYPEHCVGRFRYRFFLSGKYPEGSLRCKLAVLGFFLREGLRLSKKKKFDCVLTYGWTLTGFAGLVLSRMIRTKLIVIVPNIPENAYRYNRFGRSYEAPAENLVSRGIRTVSDLMLYIALRGAASANLRYPSQLKCYPRLSKVPTFVNHGFVAVSQEYPLPACATDRYYLPVRPGM